MVTGAGLGPLLSGVLIETLDSPQRWIFGATTVLMVIGLVVAATLPLHAPDSTQTPRRPRLPGPPRENRTELIWGASTFAPGVTATSFVLSLGPTILSDSLGVSNALLAGITVCIMFLTATSVQFIFAKMHTRTQFTASSVAGLCSMTLFALSVSSAGSVPLFVLAAVMAGVTQGMGQVAAFTLIGTRVPVQHRAETNAALNIAAYLPGAVLPVATGYLADMTALPAAVTTFAAVLGSVVLVALVAVRVSTRRHSTILVD